MTPAECEELISIAQRLNLTPGKTDIHNPLRQFQIFDFDHNDAIDLNEVRTKVLVGDNYRSLLFSSPYQMRMMLESNFDVFFGPAEIHRMYVDLRMDPNRDGK